MYRNTFNLLRKFQNKRLFAQQSRRKVNHSRSYVASIVSICSATGHSYIRKQMLTSGYGWGIIPWMMLDPRGIYDTGDVVNRFDHYQIIESGRNAPLPWGF
ncbi:hypothetical protein V6582_06500 [Agrobacterium vitis]|uniref:hypothetical protein n=1 Tax=Agrobacterium vitis TaxID=373 RepID=UPI0012E80963|nr:hypothetical protein [Agrobacterium vitis]MVA25987.1 hypothetical protein [Agrobacterium vitis]